VQAWAMASPVSQSSVERHGGPGAKPHRAHGRVRGIETQNSRARRPTTPNASPQPPTSDLRQPTAGVVASCVD
jgi:hypothetical protein